MVTKIVSGSLVDDIIQIALDNAYLLINTLIDMMFIGIRLYVYENIYIFKLFNCS